MDRWRELEDDSSRATIIVQVLMSAPVLWHARETILRVAARHPVLPSRLALHAALPRRLRPSTAEADQPQRGADAEPAARHRADASQVGGGECVGVWGWVGASGQEGMGGVAANRGKDSAGGPVQHGN